MPLVKSFLEIIKPIQVTRFHVLPGCLFKEICFCVVEAVDIGFNPTHRVIGELWIDFIESEHPQHFIGAVFNVTFHFFKIDAVNISQHIPAPRDFLFDGVSELNINPFLALTGILCRFFR